MPLCLVHNSQRSESHAAVPAFPRAQPLDALRQVRDPRGSLEGRSQLQRRSGPPLARLLHALAVCHKLRERGQGPVRLQRFQRERERDEAPQKALREQLQDATGGTADAVVHEVQAGRL